MKIGKTFIPSRCCELFQPSLAKRRSSRQASCCRLGTAKISARSLAPAAARRGNLITLRSHGARHCERACRAVQGNRMWRVRDYRAANVLYLPLKGRAIACGETRAAKSVCSPPPAGVPATLESRCGCGEGLGVGGTLANKEREESAPTPNPSPRSQRKHAARGGGEHGEVRFTVSAQMR